MAEKTEKDPFEGVIFEGEDADAGNQTDAGGGEDERLGEREGVAAHEGGAVGETEDEKRERRRKERQDKKARARQDRDELKTTKAEMAALKRRLEEVEGGVQTRVTEVERRALQNDIAAIDNRLDFLKRAYGNAQAAREKAMTEGNGTEFNRMDQSMRDADAEWRQLHQRKAQLQTAPQREQPADRPDPRVARHANAFISDFPDYDPDGRDADSKVVQALDEALTEEGLDPRTEEYWDELRDRVLDKIPEWGDQPQRQRVNGNGKPAANNRTRPRQTIAGGAGGDSAGSGAGFVVSRERVQALKDSGKWDDPQKRAKAIKAFQQWDREHAGEMRRAG
jgi:hypothetical protein